MSEFLMLALVPLARPFMVLLFLLVVYLRGGKDDLKTAADAVHKVRSTVGVAATLRALIDAMRTIKRPS